MSRVNMPALFLFLVTILTHSVQSLEETAVLILARGGSKGVKLKNLQTVGGTSLLARAIHTARAAGFEDITVSTDHPLIALEALKCNASFFHRSVITATDWAPSIWGAAEFLGSRTNVDILVLIQATSPFIQAANIRKAISKIKEVETFDCVFSVTRSFKLRWQNEGSLLRPLNFELHARPRRQDWTGEFLETGAFYITRKSLIEEGYFQNNNCTFVEVSSAESLEVDTYRDLLLANALLSQMSSNESEVTFESVEATDVVSVELVPERKGLILKHCEYLVSSRRHGTTVTRRYNEFSQLCDVLFAKYPYRAVSRLPPKRVVVGGGSERFLQRRRAALQRWLTLVARHPIVAHDADLRAFLCETSVRLDKPKHDEFVLAGTQEDTRLDMTADELRTAFTTEQEQIRLLHLGLTRLYQIFERVEARCEAERADIRELGAGLTALATPASGDTQRWRHVREALASAAELATKMGETAHEELDFTEEGPGGRVVLALDALAAQRDLCARLSKGLHAERAAAAANNSSPAAKVLRDRHRYAMTAALQDARIARAYTLGALESLPELFRTQGRAHARVAALWADLHAALAHPYCRPLKKQ